MALADDIQTLRQRGEPDDKILSALKAYTPDQAGDIDTLLKKGEQPGKILDALGSYDAQHGTDATPEQSFGQRLVGAARNGLASSLSGMSTTGKVFGQNIPGSDIADNALDGAAGLVKDGDYHDNSDHSKETWGQWFSKLPERAVGGLAASSPDIAAGAAGAAVGSAVPVVGTALGGALGFTGSYLYRNAGQSAVDNAASRQSLPAGGDFDPQNPPTTSDKARAVIGGAIEAQLARAGLGAAGGSVASALEGPLVSQVAKQVVKGAASDAAASAGQNLVHQEFTPNHTLDLGQVGDAAATGAATGGLIRTALAGRDVNVQNKTADINPEVATKLADQLSQGDMSSPAASYQTISALDDTLGNQVKQYAKDAGPQLKALQEANGFKDDTHVLLNQAQSDLSDSKPVDPAVLSTLRDRLGDHYEGANLVDALDQHSALQQVKTLGNYDDTKGTFQGGVSGNPFVQRWVNPAGTGAIKEDLLYGALTNHGLLFGHGITDPLSALKPMGAQSALYGAARGIDALLGNYNPGSSFVDRFASGDTPQAIHATNQDLPSFRQAQADAKAAEAAQRAQDSADRTAASQARVGASDKLRAAMSRAQEDRAFDNSAAADRRAAGASLLSASKARAQEDTAQENGALKTAKYLMGVRKRSDAAEAASLQASAADKLSAAKAEAAETKQQAQAADAAQAQALRNGRYLMKVRQASAAAEAKAAQEASSKPTPVASLPAPEAPTPFAQRESVGVPGMSNAALAKARTMTKVMERQANINETPMEPVPPRKAQDGDVAPTPKGTPKSAKPASDAPRPAQKAKTKDGADYHHDPENGNIIVQHGEHTVVRSTHNVRDVKAYATATHRNLAVRQSHFDAVAHLAEGEHDQGVVRSLHGLLNQRSETWDKAKGHVQEAVEERMTHTDWDKRAVIANTLLSPEMRATWTREGTGAAPKAPAKPQEAQKAPEATPQAKATANGSTKPADALEALMKAVDVAKLHDEPSVPEEAPPTPKPSKAAVAAKASKRVQAAGHEVMNDRIVKTMKALGAGPMDTVRLADLREALPDVPRATLDAHLLRIAGGKEKGMVLSSLDDNKSIKPRDREAAFSPAGDPFHIIKYGNAH